MPAKELRVKKEKSVLNSALTTLNSTLAFTLIEILIAIAIISVVAVVGIPNLRKFNENQEFSNDVSNLIRKLKQAQSSSHSSIVCSNGSTSTSWSVKLDSTPDRFSYLDSCNSSGTVDVLKSAKIVSVKTRSDEGCTLPVEIKFVNQTRTIEFLPSSGCTPTRQNLYIYLENIKNTSEKAGIVVNKGGMISQCGLDSSGECL